MAPCRKILEMGTAPSQLVQRKIIVFCGDNNRMAVVQGTDDCPRGEEGGGLYVKTHWLPTYTRAHYTKSSARGHLQITSQPSGGVIHCNAAHIPLPLNGLTTPIRGGGGGGGERKWGEGGGCYSSNAPLPKIGLHQ